MQNNHLLKKAILTLLLCAAMPILNAQVAHIGDILCEGDPTLTLVYDIARGRSLRYKYTFENPAIPSSDYVHGQQPKGQYTIDIPIAATVASNHFQILKFFMPCFYL